VYSGGSETVSGGGSDLGAVISGGVQFVYGTATAAMLFAGLAPVRSL
jgi:hypothetical protein